MANFSFVNLTQANFDSARKRSGSPVLSELDTKRSRSADMISANNDCSGLSDSTSRRMSIAGSPDSTSRHMSVAGSSATSQRMSISDIVAPAMPYTLAAAPLQPATLPAVMDVQQFSFQPTVPSASAKVLEHPPPATSDRPAPIKVEDTAISRFGSLFSGTGSDILCPGSASSTHLPNEAAAVSLTSTNTPTITPISYIDSATDPFSGEGILDDRFPVIQGLDKHELFEVVHPETLREWEAVPAPKLIIFIANDTVTDEVHHRVVLIRKALVEIFPDVIPVIGSSYPVAPSCQPVFPFLVHRIPVPYVRILTTQRYWSCADLTFFAMDFSPPPTPFVMTLQGLHLPAQPESEHVIEHIVRRKLLSSPSVTHLIGQHHDNLPDLAAAELIEHVMGTIKARSASLGENADDPVVFNIYIHPPTNDPVHHQIWLREIRAITYFTYCGTGMAAPVFRCNVCKGRDHSSPSCPFPVGAGMPANLGAAKASNDQIAQCRHYGLPMHSFVSPAHFHVFQLPPAGSGWLNADDIDVLAAQESWKVAQKDIRTLVAGWIQFWGMSVAIWYDVLSDHVQPLE
ncbi:hypothetical protein F5887DRAFT_915767 [Amanita rubescens]|nr:hypothetical protein F5887DRAFT_915767 [Amanita rubescens]